MIDPILTLLISEATIVLIAAMYATTILLVEDALYDKAAKQLFALMFIKAFLILQLIIVATAYLIFFDTPHTYNDVLYVCIVSTIIVLIVKISELLNTLR